MKSSRALQNNHNMRRFKQNLPLLALFAPIIVFFIIFKYVPMLGLVIAFKDYNFVDGVLHSPWNGLTNFRFLFQSPDTLNIIWNTFFLSVLSIVVGFPAPIILAILLNEVRKKWFKKGIQTIVYLPHFFSWVIVGGIAVTVFSQETGVVNNVLQWLGFESYPFLYKPVSWISILLGTGIWKGAGFGAIIYLAALTAIDLTLYEAASIDGANKWRQMWHITLPGLQPTIILMLILATGNVMEVGFDPIYNMQNSVVADVSNVISTYIFKAGVQGAQFSLTTAMGLFESVVGLVLVLGSNWIARRFGRGLW